MPNKNSKTNNKKVKEPLVRLSVLEKGILYYLAQSWCLSKDDNFYYLEYKGEFDCYVPDKGVKSLKEKGFIEPKRNNFDKWVISESGFFAFNSHKNSKK